MRIISLRSWRRLRWFVVVRFLDATCLTQYDGTLFHVYSWATHKQCSAMAPMDWGYVIAFGVVVYILAVVLYGGPSTVPSVRQTTRRRDPSQEPPLDRGLRSSAYFTAHVPAGIHSGEPGASCIRKAEQLESTGDPTSKSWRKGAEGERATASLLRRELPGWSCRHDVQIPNSPANIDHIATAPDGRSVCIDSKNWASWDMERLKKAVETLKWEAKEGAKIVGSPVEPVILMHGNYGGPDRVDGVRVLHSTAIGQL